MYAVGDPEIPVSEIYPKHAPDGPVTRSRPREKSNESGRSDTQRLHLQKRLFKYNWNAWNTPANMDNSTLQIDTAAAVAAGTTPR